MQDMDSLTHSVGACRYHVAGIPKYRKKKLYSDIAKYPGENFHGLVGQKESRIVEGHICEDHIHMLTGIPPEYAVSHVTGYIRGKSAISIARTYMGRKKNFTGENF
jgi:putative transposase